MEWAHSENTLKNIARSIGKVPLALENKPEPNDVIQQYIDAFMLLNEFRDGYGNIPLENIFLYADTIGDNRLEFAKIISIGNKAYLECKKTKENTNPLDDEKGEA